MPRFLLGLFSFIVGTVVFDALADQGSGSLARSLLNLVIATGVTLVIFYAGERVIIGRDTQQS